MPHVQALAGKFGAKIALLLVEPHPVLANFMDRNLQWQLHDRDEAATGCLSLIADRLRAVGLSVSTAVYEGPVADGILSHATNVHADLIAMTTHGLSGMDGLYVSGVAGRVLHAVTVPLLLVKPAQAALSEPPSEPAKSRENS